MPLRFNFAGAFGWLKGRKPQPGLAARDKGIAAHMQVAGQAQPGLAARNSSLITPARALGERDSEEARKQLKRICAGPRKMSMHRNERRERLRNALDLSGHEKLSRETLPGALRAANKTTLGIVKIVLDHPKMKPETVPAAMRLIERLDVSTTDNGGKMVCQILEHPKITPENARALLEAANTYGLNRFMYLMDNPAVNARDIPNILRSRQENSKTQWIRIDQ